jgi:uncharacterized membrane protein
MAEPWSDRRVEIIIGRLLQTGVLLSAVIVAAGAVFYLIRHGHSPALYGQFQGEPAGLTTLGGIWHSALALDARGIIQFGLVALIATPVARVVFAVVGFAEERDHLYTVVTLIVLAILIYSLFFSS